MMIFKNITFASLIFKILTNTVYLSLGSNKQNRLRHILNAVSEISVSAKQICKISNIFESKSWAYKDADYLNVVIKIETILSPEELLIKTQEIEKNLGRTSKTKIENGKPVYSSRTIDIDIIFYGNKIINTRHLKIPHPLMHLRRFVLKPMLQIAPDFIHPVLNETIDTLYKRCEDEGEVKFFRKVSEEDFLLL